MKYTEKNNIILNERHGGVKGKSTLIAVTFHQHSIQFWQKFNGICGRENDLFRSYLTGRTHFTQIEDKRSRL